MDIRITCSKKIIFFILFLFSVQPVLRADICSAATWMINPTITNQTSWSEKSIKCLVSLALGIAVYELHKIINGDSKLFNKKSSETKSNSRRDKLKGFNGELILEWIKIFMKNYISKNLYLSIFMNGITIARKLGGIREIEEAIKNYRELSANNFLEGACFAGGGAYAVHKSREINKDYLPCFIGLLKKRLTKCSYHPKEKFYKSGNLVDNSFVIGSLVGEMVYDVWNNWNPKKTFV